MEIWSPVQKYRKPIALVPRSIWMKNPPNLHLLISLWERHWEWQSPVLIKIWFAFKSTCGMLRNTWCTDICHVYQTHYRIISMPPGDQSWCKVHLRSLSSTPWNGIPWNLLNFEGEMRKPAEWKYNSGGRIPPSTHFAHFRLRVPEQGQDVWQSILISQDVWY